jgi:hypothetical protein
MLNRIYFVIACAVICVSVFPLSAQEAEKYKVRITWQAVQGAYGYSVEIKDESGKTVFNRETTVSEIVPKLPEADYSLKITVIDRFRQKVDSTPWKKITVRRSEVPLFESITPSIFEPGTKTVQVVIDGDNFDEKVALTVTDGINAIPVTNVRRVSKESIECELDLSGKPEGKYTLTIENPAHRKVVADNSLTIGELRDGSGSGGGIVTLAAGYKPVFLMSKWNTVLKNTFLGGDFYIAHSLYGMPLMSRSEMMKRIGLECAVGYEKYTTKPGEDRRTGSMTVFPIMVGFYGTIVDLASVDVIVKAGGGISYSKLVLSGISAKTSIDPIAYGGFGVRYYVSNSFFVECGADYTRTVYKSVQMQRVHGIMRIGTVF